MEKKHIPFAWLVIAFTSLYCTAQITLTCWLLTLYPQYELLSPLIVIIACFFYAGAMLLTMLTVVAEVSWKKRMKNLSLLGVPVVLLGVAILLLDTQRTSWPLLGMSLGSVLLELVICSVWLRIRHIGWGFEKR